MGVDTRTGRIECKLSNRNSHPICTQIPEAQNALTIGDNDDFHIVFMPIIQNFANIALVVWGDVEPLRAPENMRKFLTSLTHGRRVNQRHNFFDIINHHTVEEFFIPVLEPAQEYVFFNVIDFAAQITQGPFLMGVLITNAKRQQAAQSKFFTFFKRKGRRFIGRAIMQKVMTVNVAMIMGGF